MAAASNSISIGLACSRRRGHGRSHFVVQAADAKGGLCRERRGGPPGFKVIFLDHDLHWMHADNSIFKGAGKEVARFIANKNFQGIVIIHSKHQDGAAAMKKFLSNARLAPFGSFEITSEASL